MTFSPVNDFPRKCQELVSSRIWYQIMKHMKQRQCRAAKKTSTWVDTGTVLVRKLLHVKSVESRVTYPSLILPALHRCFDLLETRRRKTPSYLRPEYCVIPAYARYE